MHQEKDDIILKDIAVISIKKIMAKLHAGCLELMSLSAGKSNPLQIVLF